MLTYTPLILLVGPWNFVEAGKTTNLAVGIVERLWVGIIEKSRMSIPWLEYISKRTSHDFIVISRFIFLRDVFCNRRRG